jgi:hypothetical protein
MYKRDTLKQTKKRDNSKDKVYNGITLQITTYRHVWKLLWFKTEVKQKWLSVYIRPQISLYKKLERDDKFGETCS